MKKHFFAILSSLAFVTSLMLAPSPVQANAATNKIRAELVDYTNQKSAGPTQNYYYTAGKANTKGFRHMSAGDYKFSADKNGRAGVAKAVLTYTEYSNSTGKRQGSPLEPYAWPSSNPKVAINYSLTGRTYHGYLYNRSHSIADSLLGEKSYVSQNNFTTGTRPQNVGANQEGGMRYPERLAESYWKAHPNTSQTIKYKTTPVYQNNETMPRGSIVDVKSSDGVLNERVIVINSVEGITINYQDGSNDAIPYVKPSRAKQQTAQASQSAQPAQATTQGGWSVAPAGQVYVSQSNKYYSRVTNPANYSLMSVADAQNAGATQALRGNQYAKP